MTLSGSPPSTARRRGPRAILLTAVVVVIAAVLGILAYPSLTDTTSVPPPREPTVATDEPAAAGTTSGTAAPTTGAPRLDDPDRTSPPRDTPRDRRRQLGIAGGKVPAGVTVFDEEYPAVAKLDPDLLAALRRAARDAADQGVTFFVNSGWRSPRHQQQLLDEAVATYGSRAAAARWVATPTTSPHVTGDAVDIGTAAASSWLAAHGDEYGLCPIYRNEPWHFELRPKAVRSGCPSTYDNPTKDPRMK